MASGVRGLAQGHFSHVLSAKGIKQGWFPNLQPTTAPTKPRRPGLNPRRRVDRPELYHCTIEAAVERMDYSNDRHDSLNEEDNKLKDTLSKALRYFGLAFFSGCES